MAYLNEILAKKVKEILWIEKNLKKIIIDIFAIVFLHVIVSKQNDKKGQTAMACPLIFAPGFALGEKM